LSLDDLTPGLRDSRTTTIDESLTVPAIAPAHFGFSDMPPVFATAFLVAFVEWACIQMLRPYLSAGQRTVGVHVNLSHNAATPIGMKVTAEIELVERNDRKLRFKVTVHDEAEVISEGHHDRYIIDFDRFMARVAKKRSEPRS
jgi:fluoroacetyl-CoA thioesterase